MQTYPGFFLGMLAARAELKITWAGEGAIAKGLSRGGPAQEGQGLVADAGKDDHSDCY